MANVEALTDSPEQGNPNERPKYINKVKFKGRIETKVEVGKDGVKISYKRTCTDVITYCEHTGKDDDICYVDMNGIDTTCKSWEKDS